MPKAMRADGAVGIRAVAAAVGLMVLLAGCAEPSMTFSEAEASQASRDVTDPSGPQPTVELALAIGQAHPVIAEFLADRRYTVTDIKPRVTPNGHTGALVTISLAEPAPPEAWPERESCSIFRESEDITGVVWLADLDEETVAAVSRQWDNSVDCLGP